MQVFGRNKQSSQSEAPAVDVTDAAPVGKGRPTPSRKDAEAARKKSLKLPNDPKAAKKVLRERDRQARVSEREALMRGDERALPARDRGPVRAFVRQWVDSRRLFSELFVPMALVVLVISLIPYKPTQVVISYAWFLMLVLLIGDLSFLVYRLRKALTAQFADPADRKGAVFYGVMRAMQIRRLRLPPPKVKAGGAPVTPKAKKR